MRGLVQRVLSAGVDVVGPGDLSERSGEIESGLCVFVGVTHTDDEAAAAKLAEKIWYLRVFDDAEGVMNLSLADRVEGGGTGEVLVVSQFTLYGDTSKGRRPSWVNAARPDQAEPLVEILVDRLTRIGASVETGRFQSEMRVDIVNDGPITLMLET